MKKKAKPAAKKPAKKVRRARKAVAKRPRSKTDSLLKQLMQIMPPPKTPIASSRDWALAEKAIGTALPSDYKAFIETYGCGFVCNFLKINSPFDEDRGPIHQIESACRLYEELTPRVRLFPKPGGLLFCGTSRNGDWLFWNTEGPPDEWDMVFNENQTSSHRRLRGKRYAAFILDFITGQNKSLQYATEAFCTEGQMFRTWPEIAGTR